MMDKELNAHYLVFHVKNDLNHCRIIVAGRLTVPPLFLSRPLLTSCMCFG